ncbi:MAG: transposase family protein, partial [Fuerstiella sp.]
MSDGRTLLLAVAPVICSPLMIVVTTQTAGAEGPKSMARWAKNKKDWLATWLDLPDGKTPSRDCIRTFFARVDPTAFQACFFAWLDGLAGNSKQSNGLRIV